MAKRKRKRPVVCAYCRRIYPEHETTEDHVPPKGVFGKNRPQNIELIKVPQCWQCKEGSSKGDEVLKLIVGLGPDRPVPSEEVRDDVRRSMRFWARKLARSFIEHGHESIDEVDDGTCYRLPLSDADAKNVHSTLKRIAIGLIFKYVPEWDSRGLICGIRQVLDQDTEKAEEMLREHYEFEHEVNVGAGRFIAKWAFPSDAPQCVHVHMSFYRGMSFSVFLFPSHLFPGEMDDLRIAKF